MKTISRKLRTARSLGIGGLTTVGEAIMLLSFVRIGFRVLGVPRTQRMLGFWATHYAIPVSDADQEADLRLARCAVRLARRTIEGTCLSRSLVLCTLLRRHGIVADLKVGFRRREGRIEGHAWVELDGRPVNESPEAVLTYHASPAEFSLDDRKQKRLAL